MTSQELALDRVERAGKVHHPKGCGRGRYGGYPESLDPREVTCLVCRRYVEKHGLQPRSSFPDVPTFDVRPEGRFLYPRRSDGTRETGCHLVFRCPVCGQENNHGGLYGQPGAGDGHRVSHCPCWERGYYIREVTQ